MEKKYSAKELASILGCSVTAVNKKIKPDETNPEIKRYRQRYNTVIENGVTYILLDDTALEEEKNKSKGFNNVSNNVSNTVSTDDIIEIEPISTVSTATNAEMLHNVTNNVIMDLEQRFYNRLQEKDKQIYLLTTSENKKEGVYLATEARNKTLEKQNNVLKWLLTTLALVVITLFVTCVITFYNYKVETLKNIELQRNNNQLETLQKTLNDIKANQNKPILKRK